MADDDRLYYEGYPYAGLRGRLRRAGKHTVQRGLALLAERRRTYLTRGPRHVEPPIDYAMFGDRLWDQSTDFVRYATLELLVRRIRELPVEGALAELGVHQGHYAAVMNAHLPDRPLYLFDTFAGFDERDTPAQVERDLPPPAVSEVFERTDVEFVIAQMANRASAVPVPGWFPDSAKGLEYLRFALVSLDVDLFAPTLAGLEWFHPRLSPGGFIAVHDYNNDVYPGAGEAIDEFLSRTPVGAVPIPDEGGTMVIAKPSQQAHD